MSDPRSEHGLWRNPISYFGIILALVSGFLIVALLVLDFLGGSHSTYLGILTFMVLPAFLLGGGALFLFGMYREHRRRAREGEGEGALFPVLDLNLQRQRSRFLMYLLGAVLTLLVMGVVSYEAYHFTESVTFCGQLCHPVMTPEYTAYQRSPHARVRCADCHIGSGASWYVKSKLSGIRQVFATIFDTYRRPIPTPIENLRPARETCEQCHWPNKFYGGKLFVSPRFAYDEQNTPRTLSMLVLIGGEGGVKQGGGGIHWHMLLGNQVTYQPADERQQVISRVWSVEPGGKRTEYVLQGAETGQGEKPGGKEAVRELLVDCVACHNRPTHIYYSPEVEVDSALTAGKIDPSLPFIKRKAVEALVSPYSDEESALAGISSEIEGFYAGKYPDLVRQKGAAIKSSVAAVLEIYRNSFFPAMKASWRAYPNNIGHRDFPGCFRCHDGRHVSQDGRTITRDCGACHTTPALGPLQRWSAGYPTGREPWHPWELRGRHAAMDCDRCHDGGLPRSGTCSGCHQSPANAPMAAMKCVDCHLGEEGQSIRPQEDCAVCHDELKELHKKGDHKSEPCVTCHKPHEWKVSGREVCLSCHDEKKAHRGALACASCHPFRGGKK